MQLTVYIGEKWLEFGGPAASLKSFITILLLSAVAAGWHSIVGGISFVKDCCWSSGGSKSSMLLGGSRSSSITVAWIKYVGKQI